MLKGLSVTEVSLSEVLKTSIMRIESEFYNSEKMVYPYCKKGKDIIVFSQYGTSKDLNEVSLGYPVLRLNEYNQSFISEPAKYCNLIDEQTYNQLKLKKGDVLICRTNGNPKYVGKSALVMKDYEYAFASYLFRVRPNVSLISPAALVAFLNSKFGRIEIERYSMVSNQANFSPAKFREINIPILPDTVVKTIDRLMEDAFMSLENSEALYNVAQQELVDILGLQGFEEDSSTYSVQPFKSSFLASGRLDAEYYRPKYDNLIKYLRTLPYSTIGELATIQKSVEPGSKVYQEEGIPFIRVQDLTKFGITESDIHLPEKEFAKVIRPQKDTILMSKDGSVGIAYKMEQDSNCITSGAILHLKLKDKRVLPDYVTLVLNSIVVGLQAERDAGGSIIQHWKPSEIENVIIPILSIDKQKELSEKIQQSFNLRKESLRLQKEAKELVEKTIAEA